VEHALAQFLHDFTYPAVVLILSAAGLGVPISEDLTLLLAGALAARGITSFWPTLAAGYFGVILGDALIHAWGKRLGPAAYSTKRVQKALSLERQAKLRHHYAKHGFWTVVVGRHTPILRAPIFFLAGASGVPRLKFIIADAVSAAVTVPIVTALGFYFGEHLDDVRHKIHQVQWVLGGAVVLALLGFWFFRRRAARRKLREAALAAMKHIETGEQGSAVKQPS
jgi:membrane protein DedA with SNARE-associated domain